jgi:DNA-directed RNA polymerase specialized sigma24 family protein
MLPPDRRIEQSRFDDLRREDACVLASAGTGSRTLYFSDDYDVVPALRPPDKSRQQLAVNGVYMVASNSMWTWADIAALHLGFFGDSRMQCSDGQHGRIPNCESVMKKLSKGQLAEYATRADFCKIFEEQMDRLYLLSFLLTANHTKAKQCFLSTLENVTEDTGVFVDFANSWARRTIIQSAIRLLDLGPWKQGIASHAFEQTGECDVFPSEQREILAILELPSFERIVFVMSILERYSHQECAVMLGCSRGDVVTALTSAFQQIGNSMELATGELQAVTTEQALGC